ncbi:MAG: Phosphoserine phosphatase [Myxococcaceae bacterium]|nr:Phosphoserine phosphatase [Myxococcaceae bacterium]
MRPAALFDVDRTLVTVNTARLYVGWRMQQRQASLLDYLRVSRVLVQYAIGTLEPEHAARHAFETVRGTSEAQLREECLGWYARVVRPYISGHGRREVERRRSEGHLLAILSASTPYLTEPLAEELGIDHVLCTRLEVNDGLFTGGWEAPLCYGPGKVTRASDWALTHGIDLARSSFYTDSISDLPMLEAVGSPRVVNPDPRLRLVAARRRYPVESWK